AIHVVRQRHSVESAEKRNAHSSATKAGSVGKPSAAAPAVVRAHAAEAYGKLPLSFERNQGQSDPQVKFLARGAGYSVFLTSNDATIRVEAKSSERSKSDTAATTSSSAIRLVLANSNPNPATEAQEPQAGKSNYFIGDNPANWHCDVAQF